MFTGIVRHVGTVLDARAGGGGRRLTVDLGPLAEGLATGDSVAVSGVCLTATGLAAAAATFDVVAETASRTTLGALTVGAKVNLERALQLGGTLDGHLVAGHVDGVAEVRSVDRGPNRRQVEFTAPSELTDAMVPKGSVALDGVSLTLVEAAGGTFCVALIPATLAGTTLGDLAAGAKVNVETDLIGKYVRRCLQALAGGGELTLAKLRQAGFA